MTIETEHNGRKITYAENQDVWRCWAMNVEAKTLTALKSKLDKIDADARRIDATRAYLLDHHGEKLTPVTVTLIAKPAEGGFRSREPLAPAVHITHEGGGKREKVDLSRLVRPTREAKAAVEAWRDAKRVRDDANEKVKIAAAAIPRMTLDDLKTTKEGEA